MAIFIILSGKLELEGASTANLIFSNQLKLPFQQMIYHGADSLSFGPVINLDPHLLESHERPHAYAANDNGVRPTLVEQCYRPLAASLNMRRILHHRNILNFPVFNVNQGKDLAMTEVPRPQRVKTAWKS